MTADWMPDLPGRRSLAVTAGFDTAGLAAPAARAALADDPDALRARLRLANAALTLRFDPDVDGALDSAQLARLLRPWGALVPADARAALAALPLDGGLWLDATSDGPLDDPAVAVAAAWQPVAVDRAAPPSDAPAAVATAVGAVPSDAPVRLTGTVRPLRPSADLALRFDAFDLGDAAARVVRFVEAAPRDAETLPAPVAAEIVGVPIDGAVAAADVVPADASRRQLARDLADVRGRLDGEIVLRGDPETFDVRAQIADLALAMPARALTLAHTTGQIAGRAQRADRDDWTAVAGYAFTGGATLDLRDLRLGADLPRLAELGLEAELQRSAIESPAVPPRLTVHRVSAEFVELPDQPASTRALMSGGGHVTLTSPLTDAAFDVRLVDPLPGVQGVLLDARLVPGGVRVTLPEAQTDAGPLQLDLDAPFTALRRMPALAAWLDALPFALAPDDDAFDDPNRLRLAFAVPRLDSDSLLPLLGQPALPQNARLRGGLAARLRVDLADPLAGDGALRLDDLRLRVADRSIDADAPLRFVLGDRRWVLEPCDLQLDDRSLRARATLALGDWRPTVPFAPPAPDALVRRVDARVDGTFDTDLLNPLIADVLPGAGAAGAVALDLVVAGPLDALEGTVRLDGEDVQLVALEPYLTRVTRPRLDARFRDGALILDGLTMRVNEGDVRLDGTAGVDGQLDLAVALAGVRYRLDYGLTTVLDGNLRVASPAQDAPLDQPMRVSGDVTVGRGVLLRDVDLDREILSRLFPGSAALSIAGDATIESRPIELDVRVSSREGVRVRNNVADLRAVWSDLRIGGTVAAPRVEGAIDLARDGFVFAYGQTVRIDRGQLRFRGSLEPEIDLTLTTSLQDPTVAAQGADRLGQRLVGEPDDAFASDTADASQAGTRGDAAGGADSDVGSALGTGLAGYFGNRLVGSALGGGRGGFEVGKPVVIFGETDPGTRLTISRPLTDALRLAASYDITEGNERIYLLEYEGGVRLASLVAQVFTTDVGQEGATLRQQVEWGADAADARLPRIEDVRIGLRAPASAAATRAPADAPSDAASALPLAALPELLDDRALRRAVPYREGDRLPAGGDFDIEVDLVDYLRRRGFSDPRVAVETPTRAPGEVDVRIGLTPGPQVALRFVGDVEPKRADRRAIASLYRTDYAEPLALDEMRDATVRSLRAQGYVAPTVEVYVIDDAPVTDAVIDERAAAQAAMAEAGRARDEDAVPVDARMPDESSPPVDAAAADPDAATATPADAAPSDDATAARGMTMREIVIEIAVGPQRKLRAPRFAAAPGTPRLTEPVAASLAGRFADPVTRAELAAGEPSATQRLRRTLQNLGYVRPQIVSRFLPADGDTLELELDLGPRRWVRTVALTPIGPRADALDDAALADLRALLPRLVDAPLRASAVNAGVIALESALRARGYDRVIVRDRLMEVDASAVRGEVDAEDLVLTYEIDPGLRYVVDEITYEGIRITRNRWLKRVADLESGVFYSRARIDAARRRLFDTGLFRTVLPRIEDAEGDGLTDIRFELEEQPHWSLAYGGRYEREEGFGVITDLLRRNVSGRGVDLGVRLVWSQDDARARLYGRLPRVLGTSTDIDLFVEGRDRTEEGVNTRSVETSLRWTIPLRRALQTRFYVRYRDSHLTDDPPVDPPTLALDERIVAPELGWQLILDTRDDRLAARRGWFASLDVSGSGAPIGSDFAYLRSLAQAYHYRPLGRVFGLGVTWAQGVRVGVARPFEGQDLARDVRFFTGGEYSVRGYRTDSVGPLEPFRSDDRAAGGEALFVLNSELRFDLGWQGLGFVTFVDGGNVWAARGDFDVSDLVWGAGVGLRAATPVGLLRADFAFPLDGDDQQDYRIYLGFGSAF
ncbi:MAG: translocation/assembly module TamB domain-containing protein [Acidobacteriota bacterium]